MNPTLTEGGPLWLLALLAGMAWAWLAITLWREARPRNRRETHRPRGLVVNLLAMKTHKHKH
jgi:hypothetical protein